MYHMRTATVREVRHKFGDVIASVEAGDSVAISKRGQIIAVISPPPIAKKNAKKAPDFAARMKRRFGVRKFSSNVIVEERESRDY
jgi:prevent-host-death family protein